MNPVRAHILQAGHCLQREGAAMRGAPMRTIPFPALFGLIEHPSEGPILFDTGYSQAFLTATEPFPERFFRWTTPMVLAPGADAASQLKRRNIEPRDVSHVVVSHFHADHVAGLRDFPGATIHCARAGHEDILRRGRFSAVKKGLLRALLPDDLAARAAYFEDRPRVRPPAEVDLFEDAVDLFADGRMIMLPLPGHCIGQWGLLVWDEARGPMFFVADAAYSTRGIKENRPPPYMTNAMLGDPAAIVATLDRLHRLSLRDSHPFFVPSHCRERAAEAEA